MDGAPVVMAVAPDRSMNDEQRQLCALVGLLPARLTAEQTALLLACQPYDIPVLIAARLLKPLGDPLPSSRKYFAGIEIAELMRDRPWLGRMTSTLQRYWLRRNQCHAHRCLAEPEVEAVPHVLPARLAGKAPKLLGYHG